MKRSLWRGMTLTGRTVWFLVLFIAMLTTQMILWNYQSTHILKPTQEKIETIRAISRFLNQSKACLENMEEYHWNYGESRAFLEELQNYLSDTQTELTHIHQELPKVTEDYVMLCGALETTHTYVSHQIESIIDLLSNASGKEASVVYYDKLRSAFIYLGQYANELLEQAIQDNYGSFAEMRQTSERLNEVRTVLTFLSIVAAAMMTVSLFHLLRSIVLLSRASRDIRDGKLDTPDVDDSRPDEIGHLAKTFNDMKHSMQEQIRLVEEKTEIEHTLRLKETEALEMRHVIEAGKLQLLRSQVQPHFLFNTLNVIMYNASLENAKKTSALLAALSRSFRYALGSNNSMILLAREIAFINDSFSLYQARFGEKIALRWHIPPQFEPSEWMIPSFLIQPLVENAVRHGLAPKEENGSVDIFMQISGEELLVAVEDDGIGMSEETLSSLKRSLADQRIPERHIGLYNVASRLRLAGRKDGLTIVSGVGKGTKVQARIPMKPAESFEGGACDE